jgi:hypothetical protein
VEKIIESFNPISLEEMKSVKLMNRTDTKFVTNTSKLCELLKMAQHDYYVQEIDGERNLEYDTTYFDTRHSTCTLCTSADMLTDRRYASAHTA